VALCEDPGVLSGLAVETVSFDRLPAVSFELAGILEVWGNAVAATSNIANIMHPFFMALYFV
jgi:hypothetical protein